MIGFISLLKLFLAAIILRLVLMYLYCVTSKFKVCVGGARYGRSMCNHSAGVVQRLRKVTREVNLYVVSRRSREVGNRKEVEEREMGHSHRGECYVPREVNRMGGTMQ